MTETSKQARLSPAKIKILYYLRKHKNFRGSIVALSKELGYKGDSRTNINLNELIREGYVMEKPSAEGSAYEITQKGANQILFLVLPDALIIIIAVVGAIQVYLGLLAIFNISPLSVISAVAGGAILLAFSPIFWRIKNRVIEEFLQIDRDALSD